jgi:hypothetical protein
MPAAGGDCIFDRLPGGDCADLAHDVLHVLTLSTKEFSRDEKDFQIEMIANQPGPCPRTAFR